jgi:hypothetical protein
MNDPLFDHAFRRDIARLADAMEGLLAYLVGATPTLAAKPPADFDSAQYADAFDAKMGNPMQALGRLTPVAAPAADPNDDDIDADLDYLFGATPTRARYTYTHWSKYDTRCRELARLRTDAKHRAAAAKNPEQRAAALRELKQAKSEANRRQAVLRQLFYRDDVIDFVKGELVVYDLFDNVGLCKWRSEFLQAPDYTLTFIK